MPAATSYLDDGRVSDRPPLAQLASLLADGTRARFCLALLNGRSWTAGELARQAKVTPSTASEHLTLLVNAGLLAEERQGRHRYVRLAGPVVADLIEDLAAHAEGTFSGYASRTLRAAIQQRAFARARTCYDHLAGRLGVAVTDAMLAAGLLQRDTGFALTDAGTAWLKNLVGELRPGRRHVVRACLDRTERRTHLGGAAGAALCAHVLRHGWAVRIGTGRALRVTDLGRRALHDLLGLDPAEL